MRYHFLKRRPGRARVIGALAVFLALAGASSEAIAADAVVSADAVRAHLDDAKAVNTKAHQQAAAALLASCEAQIRSAVSKNQPDLAGQIKKQEQAFTATGALPDLPAVKSAVDDYRDAVMLADENLDRAYGRAVRRYSSLGKTDTAMAVEQEKSTWSRQRTATDSGAAPVGGGTAAGDHPPTALATLAAAKVQYRTDVHSAEKELNTRMDARLNSALDAGDLQSALSLQTMIDGLKNQGQIPAGADDPAVAAAVVVYRHSIQAANVRMARAFAGAVRDLTRARQLDQAKALQDEFVASELSDIDTAPGPGNVAASPADTTYVLGRHLPDFLTTADHWDLHPAGGVFLARRMFLRSRNGDFLDRDFTCDLWFTVETTGTNMFIGVGDGRGRPDNDCPLNALALNVPSPDLNNGAVGFLRADGQIDTIGQLPGPGDYVARLEKAGKVLSLSIGDEDADGTFNAKVSTTVSDPSVLAPFLTTHNAHLFFGGGRFWKMRFINGRPPAYVPDVVSKTLMNG